MKLKTIVTKNNDQTFNLGKAMAKDLRGGEVFALTGDLGSGKTVFAQGLASGLGISQKVTSPTFQILKQYPVQHYQISMMYHADLYRTGDIREIREIGLLDMMSEQNCVTVIEWPEKMVNLLPGDTKHLTFFYDSQDSRLIIDGEIENYINSAVEIVKAGGVIIFPTDTAYGMGCRIDNEESVKKLFELRQRPLTKATPVLFDSIDQVNNYVKEIPTDVRENLMEKYWPGALTIILQAKKEKVTNQVLGGGSTIGVRIPGNEIIREIITQAGVPIIGTSANFHGQMTPYCYEELDPKLTGLVDMVVPGVCTVKKESTVIDAIVSPWKILRQGAIEIKN